MTFMEIQLSNRVVELEDNVRFLTTYNQTLKELSQRYLTELNDLTAIIKRLTEENGDLNTLLDAQTKEEDVCRHSAKEFTL